MNTRSFILSALIAGAVLGTLANLPLLNFLNCILCLWVWLGGIFAVYLYRRFEHGESSLSVGQGAAVGALAGLVGVLVGAVVYALTSVITLPMMQSLARTLDVDLPMQGSDASAIVGSLIFFVVANMVLYPIFGAIGGLLGAGLFWKKA